MLEISPLKKRAAPYQKPGGQFSGISSNGCAFFATALSRGQKQNPYLHTQIGVSEFNLDDDLLSHG
ncbi:MULTISPECIES: hypothetical protein, partial [unclassified Pseudomonas]|uniref:hypothetical protein n=1 Tax=unclassified Pseudomonas TaxID=196821 RepID=UPI001C4875B1